MTPWMSILRLCWWIISILNEITGYSLLGPGLFRFCIIPHRGRSSADHKNPQKIPSSARGRPRIIRTRAHCNSVVKLRLCAIKNSKTKKHRHYNRCTIFAWRTQRINGIQCENSTSDSWIVYRGKPSKAEKEKNLQTEWFFANSAL